MAGGTALLWTAQLLGKPVTPRRVISLQNLTRLLGQLKYSPVLELGALVCLATLSGEIPGENGIPSILAQAARSVGFPAIRRTATLGGNLANGLMISQLLPVLSVLGASIQLRSISEQRSVDLAQSVVDEVFYPIASSGEIITSVSIPEDSVQGRQSYLDFVFPGKYPVVVASAYWQGFLRVALLSDQKLCLWTTETDHSMREKKVAELTDAACLSFGLTNEGPLGQVDVYRRRAMVAKAMKSTIID